MCPRCQERGHAALRQTSEIDALSHCGRVRRKLRGQEMVDPSYRLMARWLSSRSVPRTRRLLSHVLSGTGLESPEGLPLVGCGLSLTYCYWFRAEGDDSSWREVNFFDYDFSPSLGLALADRHSPNVRKSPGEKPDRSSPTAETLPAERLTAACGSDFRTFDEGAGLAGHRRRIVSSFFGGARVGAACASEEAQVEKWHQEGSTRHVRQNLLTMSATSE